MGQITDAVIECAYESGLLAELDSVRHTPPSEGADDPSTIPMSRCSAP